jgi:hypothetical protein
MNINIADVEILLSEPRSSPSQFDTYEPDLLRYP